MNQDIVNPVPLKYLNDRGQDSGMKRILFPTAACITGNAAFIALYSSHPHSGDLIPASSPVMKAENSPAWHEVMEENAYISCSAALLKDGIFFSIL